MLIAIGICTLATVILFIGIMYSGGLAAKEDAKCTSRGQATVISVSQVDPSPDSMVQLALVLKIDPDDTAHETFFTDRILQSVLILHVSRFTHGATIPVRYDPSNHKNIKFRF